MHANESPQPIIDAHAYCFPPLDSPSGLPLDEKLRRLQQELGTHHTFTMRESDRALVDNSSLVDEHGELRRVRWKRDSLNRLAWEYEGETYYKGNLPPLLENAEFKPEQLVSAMDFTQVDMSILHTYPTFGVMNRMHRQAVRRHPERLRRLVALPFDSQSPDQFAERIEEEIEAGGVCGLQFFTGWYGTRFRDSWESPHMDAFWQFTLSHDLPVYFTLALGHPSQFESSGKSFYMRELERLTRWLERYPEATVVLTHGLPWRSYIENDRIVFPDEIWNVFQHPECYLQLLLPLRVGDLWDYPYTEVAPAILECAERVGVERLAWGTDMPMVERYCTYRQSITHISRHVEGLSREDVGLLLGGNVRRLLDRTDRVSPLPASSEFSAHLASMNWQSSRQQPAIAGETLDMIRTPALVVDVDAMHQNIRTMNRILENHPNVRIRPHSKTHKCSEIATIQAEEHRSRRVCCQKVSEAEAMFEGGIFDILITNQIVDPGKLNLIADLNLRGARIAVCVDHDEQLRLLETAMSGRGTQITALVELDVGGQRGGVAAPEDVLKLVRFIDASPSITFGGIQAYHGIAQHARRHEERREFVTQARRKLGRTRSLLDEHDFVVGTITGGGTGTAELDAATGIYNEIQAGSYIFGDVDYSKNLDENGEPISKWKQSLFVLGTVVSNHDRFGSSGCMIDVGMKGVSFDSGPPVVVGHPEVEFVNLGDEHSYLKGPRLDIGSQVKLVPGHCDPTVNLYPFLVAVKGKTVRDIWAVDGRGPGL